MMKCLQIFEPKKGVKRRKFFVWIEIMIAQCLLAILMPSVLRAQTAFTPGNLVVERVGDVSTTLRSSAAPINFLEFTTSSNQTIPVQSIGTPASTIVESGSAGSDGHLTLRADSPKLVFVAYSAATGYTVVSSTLNAVTRDVDSVTSGGTVS